MIDEQWRGWSLRAATPLVALALALTIGLLAMRLAFSELIDALITYFIVLVLWPALFLAAVYRAVTYTYRITSLALVVDRGPRNRPIAPLWYAEMKEIGEGGGRFYAWLDVGWVRVTMLDGRVVDLPAIRDAKGFAAALRERSATARQLTKVSAEAAPAPSGSAAMPAEAAETVPE